MARRRAERRRAVRRGSDRRWQAILAAGSRVFRRLGYAQATLEEVARELGINRATLYYYVADKAELLVAILDEPVQQMTRVLREIRDLDLPAKEKLRRAVAAHMRALRVNYPELFVFFAENLHTLPVRGDGGLKLHAEGWGDLFTSIIAEGMHSGEFRADLDPRLVMLATVGMMNWSHRWYTPESAHGLEEIGAQFAELVLGGLLRK
jgi:AcrR family transcriptional regulator